MYVHVYMHRCICTHLLVCFARRPHRRNGYIYFMYIYPYISTAYVYSMYCVDTQISKILPLLSICTRTYPSPFMPLSVHIAYRTGHNHLSTYLSRISHTSILCLRRTRRCQRKRRGRGFSSTKDTVCMCIYAISLVYLYAGWRWMYVSIYA